MATVSVSTGSAKSGSAAPPLLVCFSHLRWNFVFQRPQHLLTRAARTHRVIYVEEPIEQTADAPVWCLTEDRGVTIATPVLPCGLAPAVRSCLLEGLMTRLLKGDVVDIAWFYTPMALEFARNMPATVTVYDNMDELALFHLADSSIGQLETELMARADLVFTGGFSLYEAKRHRHHNIHPVPSSIDVEHFRRDRAKPLPEPPELAMIGRPRVGFFGVIDERMDMALLDAVSAMRPDLAFIMVGPVVKIDPATCPERANIHWLGSRDYAELPRHLHHWDCGIMPFALNDATRFISPTKTPEFLAAGLPVVSTPVRDVINPYATLGLVRIGATPADFSRGIDAAIADAALPEWRRAVSAQLATSSWDSTWASMQGRIVEAVASDVEYADA
ncbi:glycosyltransferase [Sandarakinorhabdus rubra]|uniref:glycosyltransferase n=1 Tax=Sandarakinorhabdus rubra TaxID=2672568 RepID=UPI0013DA7D0A|nr:glycosyltransferase [Sandarakinorhabdus rubra]